MSPFEKKIGGSNRHTFPSRTLTLHVQRNSALPNPICSDCAIIFNKRAANVAGAAVQFLRKLLRKCILANRSVFPIITLALMTRLLFPMVRNENGSDCHDLANFSTARGFARRRKGGDEDQIGVLRGIKNAGNRGAERKSE